MLVAHAAYSFQGIATTRLVAVGAIGQAGSQAKQDPKSLLRLARQAIDKRQYAQADAFVRQAERSWGTVRFSPFGDTPKKVRRDLDAAKKRGNAATPPSRSSRPLFASPFSAKKAEPKQDPFKNAGQNVDALLHDKKGKATHFLRKGRDAHARGDHPGAEHYTKMALEVQATFGPQEDSPQKLWAELTNGAPLPIHRNPRGLSATRTAPPARVSSDLRGLALKSLPSSPAPGQIQVSPPRTLPATSQLGASAVPGRAPSAVGRAIYNPQADRSRAVVAGGVLPQYPRTSQADQTIQLVAGYEDAGSSVNPVRAASASAEPNQVQTPRSSFQGQLQESPANTAKFVVNTPQAANTAAPNNRSFAERLIEQGELALRERDPNRAAGYFKQASAYRSDMGPAMVQRLDNRIQLAAIPGNSSSQSPNRLIDQSSDKELRLRQQLNFEVKRRVGDALQLTERDPNRAMELLTETATFVEESELSSNDKRQLQGFVQRKLTDVRKYTVDHRAEINLNETNESRLAEIDRKKKHGIEVDHRLAKLVDEFNRLRDEERYDEAVVIGKKARELAPDNAVSRQLWQEARFIQRIRKTISINEQKESRFVSTLQSVDASSIPFDDSNPIEYVEGWEGLVRGREQFRDSDRKRHPKEIEIENKLSSNVSLKFRETPLSEVVNYLKDVSGINIYLDPMGLSEEGVHPSTPVTIDLPQEISMKSALTLILAPLHLNYVVENEVLKITSEQLRDSSVYTTMYNVADLVIPLPNFAPHNMLGLPQAMSQAYATTIGSLGGNAAPVMVTADPVGLPGGIESAQGLAQTIDPSGFSSGGRGGATNADFDPLIELITTTIEPDSWEDAGGAGRLSEFETNLSLVVSSTQDVHDKIRDLLEQLRRLQDLQVTIEVRFISLDDDFFERIGVDFNFNLDDKSPSFNADLDNQTHTSTVGLQGVDPTTGDPSYTSDLDIRVRNGSFPGLIPGGFAGFDPVSSVGTSLGFAILSDIEAFFLIEASQSDRRSNVLQAPKVTLFNGQAASISSQLQKPFVTSVIPVVGDFAAAQAPVIAILPEGTTLSVQAVVSADRRYVRLTLIPFFSEIRDVETFTFTGSTTTTTSASDDSADSGDTTSTATAGTTTTSGTTIQLPEFQFTTVTTTVSVPDGGTVLLGGIKRLTERRTEHGTPILAKLPYISRLFKNVGIGRETQSLMLMVTPRIIIQEEEEMRMGL